MNFKLDRSNGKFELAARKIDLTGLYAPVAVQMAADQYYANAVLSEKQTEDLCCLFMDGFADTLKLDRDKSKLFQNSKRDNADDLKLKGRYTMRDDMNMNEYDVYMSFGSVETIIPAGAMRLIDGGKCLLYKQSYGGNDLLYSARFYLEKGEFEIVIKNRDLQAVKDDDRFSLAIGNYWQMALLKEEDDEK